MSVKIRNQQVGIITVPLVEKAVDGGIFTYYIGYVTPAPEKATSGPLTSWATWELVYN